MSLAKALEAACRVHVKFANREDPELQRLREEHWQSVADHIELIIDRKLEELTAPPKKVKRG